MPLNPELAETSGKALGWPSEPEGEGHGEELKFTHLEWICRNPLSGLERKLMLAYFVVNTP